MPKAGTRPLSIYKDILKHVLNIFFEKSYYVTVRCSVSCMCETAFTSKVIHAYTKWLSIHIHSACFYMIYLILSYFIYGL